MGELSDHDVRERLRAHQGSGPISRLFETGEIVDGAELQTALSLRMDALEDDGKHAEAESLGDVLTYVCDVMDRPPVPNWVNR
ncbi:hypothetical protein AB0O76_04800 [Streptomyces sp. NPDC086554]|uniref:hypothetical protein n=1 Tax=Streptomyces sp. NPDC086554 TaxID=3154864 RepID=UPI00343D4317